MESLICLPELKRLRCRHVPSCYLPREAQEEREHWEATYSSNIAEVVSHHSGTRDLMHPHEICPLTTICLFHKSYCVIYVIQPTFCFPIKYRNRTPNDHEHIEFLLNMYNLAKCSKYEVCLYCTNKGLYIYVNKMVELATHSNRSALQLQMLSS